MTPKPDADVSPDEQETGSLRSNRLVRLFFREPSRFGEVQEIGSHEVPQPHRQLLDHRSHMTVTMETFVGGSLDLRVLQEWRETVARSEDARGTHVGQLYAREILLLSSSGEPVQYGIVRVDLEAVPPAVRERILAGSAPLGRVLIEAGTLRDVHDVALLRVASGVELARRIGVDPSRTLYGRVAIISLTPASLLPGFSAPGTRPLDSAASLQPAQLPRPAVELLEIPLVG